MNNNNIDSLTVDDGIITVPMVAVVATVALACGIALNDDSDLYDIAYIFYEKYKDNQEIIKNTFDVGVSILGNKVVNVSKDFLELIKGAFDDYNSIYLGESLYIPGYGLSKPILITSASSDYEYVYMGDYYIRYFKGGCNVYHKNYLVCSLTTTIPNTVNWFQLVCKSDGLHYLKWTGKYYSYYSYTKLNYSSNAGAKVSGLYIWKNLRLLIFCEGPQ